MIDFRTLFRSNAYFQGLGAASPAGLTPEHALARLEGDIVLPSVELDEQLAGWIEELDRHGVGHAVSIAETRDELAHLGEASESTRDRLLPFAAVDPLTKGALGDLERWWESGQVRGLALSPGRDSYSLSDGPADDLLAAAQEMELVCVVECGVPDRSLDRAFGIARDFDAQLANPLELLVPAERHPGLTFVVSSFGAGFFRELCLLATEVGNVWADTSSSNTWRRSETATARLSDVFERALDVFGPKRLLFGTGSGAPHAGWFHEILVRQREAVAACGATPVDCDRIFDGNARELLELPAPSRVHQPTAL